MEKVRAHTLNTRVGNLLVAVNSDDAVCVVTFEGAARLEAWVQSFAPENEIAWGEFDHRVFEQLGQYLSGKRNAFDVVTDERGTPFQRAVYAQLRNIEYGDTISYSELAARMNNPNSIRAVGTANGQNPLALLNPCHRVIGADGDLRGFAGGVEKKRALLELERAKCVAQREMF